MTHHPSQDTPNPAGEVVRHDLGGWISGPCLDDDTIAAVAALRGTEAVTADDLNVGDIIVITNVEATITHIEIGQHRVRGALVHSAYALDWRELDGSARGVMFRRGSDTL